MSNYFSVRHSRSFIPAVRSLLSSPRRFFEGMTKSESYRDSLVFLGIVLFVLGGATAIMAEAKAYIVLPGCLIAGLVVSWFWSNYMAWTARIFAGIELSEESAFQICAYSSVPMMFDWIPYAVVGMVGLQFYLNWRGLVSHAGMTAGAASMIILIPLTFLLALGVAVLMMLALSGLDVVTPYLAK